MDFKIGDIVERINDDNEGVNPGDICKITRVEEVIDKTYSQRIWVDKGNQGGNCWHTNDNFKLVSKINNEDMNIFTSEDNRALSFYGFGTKCELSEEGRNAFVDYIYETGDATKDGFVKYVVERYKEQVSKK